MENWNVLLTAALFKGIEEEELRTTLECLHAHVVQHRKGDFLLLAGSKPQHIGIVTSGRAQVMREDKDGNQTLLATLEAAEIYAETLCCAQVEESPVSVLADVDTTVLLLPYPRIMQACTNACAAHQTIIRNLLRLVAQKNLYLQDRIDILRTKSVREKMLRYLRQIGANPGESVALPLNRQEMANYLGVERSALSHELMRMKREGLLEYHKNRFMLM